MSDTKISYTSKTYDTIFKDLVSAIPTLTDKWKNYSDDDPGIVIIKLMASVGDMLCYNMDYQVNETFPQTALQRRHAQKSYDLIGYKMHWYRSATCNLTMTLNVPDTLPEHTFIVTIPEWSTILSSGGVPYTIIGPANTRTFNVTPNSSSVTISDVVAVQGAMKTLSNIYPQNITNDGRIYLTDINVDEDNQNDRNYPHMSVATYGPNNTEITFGQSEWVKVGNLLDNAEAGMYYEFRVDDNDQPYIKLNDGWEDYIREGCYLVIKYIVSNGADGNVRENVGFRFNDSINSEPQTVDLRNYITISNTQSNSGENPETVEEAAIKGPKEARTLGVAITLEDYEILAETIDGVRACKALDSNISLGTKTNELELTVPASSVGYIKFALDTNSGDNILPGTLHIALTDGSWEAVLHDVDGELILDTNHSSSGVNMTGSITYSSGQVVIASNEFLDNLELELNISAQYDLVSPPYTVVLKLIANDYRDIPASTISKLETLFRNKSVITISQIYDNGDIETVPFNISVYSYEPLTITETNNEIITAINDTLYDYFDSSAREFGETFRYPDLSYLVQNCSDRIKYSQLDYPNRNLTISPLSYPRLGPVVVNFSEDSDYQWLMNNIFDEDLIGYDNYDELLLALFGASGFSNILGDENVDIDHIQYKMNLPATLSNVGLEIDEETQYYDFPITWWCSRPDIINVEENQSAIWGSITPPVNDTKVTLYAIVGYPKLHSESEWPESLAHMVLTREPVNCTVIGG